MSKLCQINERAIESFAKEVYNQSRKLLQEKIDQAHDCLGKVAGLYHELCEIYHKGIEYASSVVSRIRDAYNSKISSNKQPAKFETIIYPDGKKEERVTQKWIAWKEKADTLKSLGEEVAKAERWLQAYHEELAELRQEFEYFGYIYQIKQLSYAITEVVRSARAKYENVSRKCNDAKSFIAKAKGRAGCLPKIDDGGYVDFDGLNIYATLLESQIVLCKSKYQKLSQTTDNLYYGWNDPVYQHFQSQVETSVNERVAQVGKLLDELQKAVKEMLYYLDKYLKVEPNK